MQKKTPFTIEALFAFSLAAVEYQKAFDRLYKFGAPEEERYYDANRRYTSAWLAVHGADA